MNPTDGPEPSRADCFVTTRWTMVLAAGRQSSPDSARALGELCRVYWYPLYAYVRRKGHTREDAEDLTQAFFARFLEKNPLDGVAAERGRFRAFLLASMKHFLANEWDRSRAQKRGGGVANLSLDWEDADHRYHMDPADPVNPETLFDREWALALLDRVLGRLCEECAGEGKASLFEATKGFLTGGTGDSGYADVGRQLGMEEGAVRVAVHRLRKRYRLLLREEIAQTLADPSTVEEELKSLREALG